MNRSRLRIAILMVAALAAAVPVLAGRNDRWLVGNSPREAPISVVARS